MKRINDVLLRWISVLLLIGSLLAFLLVSERAVSALWQLYIFHGYETKGVITLSLKNAVVFAVSMMVLLIGSLVVMRISERRSGADGKKLAKFSAIIAASGFALYWLIALSPLNEWR